MPGGEEYPAIDSSDTSKKEFRMSKMPYQSKKHLDLLKASFHTISDKKQFLYPGTVTR